MAKENKLFKQFIAKVEIDDVERTVTAIISTDSVDRDGEVVLPKGANLESYLKNPVMLWAHDYYEPPIGRTLWIKTGRNNIKAKAQFAETEKAMEIYELFKGGFLNAFSIGFIPKKSHAPEPKEIEKRPEWVEARRIYDEWELLEFSVVPVPANPEALATSIKSKQLKLSDETIKELDIEIEDEEIFLTTQKQTYDCECIECGEKLSSDKHCKDLKCPKCGGQMRRVERPGPGQASLELPVKKPSIIQIRRPVIIQRPLNVPVKRPVRVVKISRAASAEEVAKLVKAKIKGRIYV